VSVVEELFSDAIPWTVGPIRLDGLTGCKVDVSVFGELAEKSRHSSQSEEEGKS
jgi:hypothetical protein